MWKERKSRKPNKFLGNSKIYQKNEKKSKKNRKFLKNKFLKKMGKFPKIIEKMSRKLDIFQEKTNSHK